MAIMKVKEVIERFTAMKPDDEVWITYISKDDIAEAFSNMEYTDENDNLIETDKYVNDDVVKRVIESIDNDDYLWERFNENYNEACRDILDEVLTEAKEAEQDTELWDTEATDVSQ